MLTRDPGGLGGGWGWGDRCFSGASRTGHCDEPWAKNCVRFLPQFLSLISMVREGTRKTPVPSPPAPSLPPWFRILLPFLRRLCNAGMKDGGGEFG